MNLKIKFGASLFVGAIMIFASMTRLEAKPSVSSEDGIVIAAEATEGDNGKIHLVCSMTNGSHFILVGAFPVSSEESYCFQFRLRDASEKYLRMNDD